MTEASIRLARHDDIEQLVEIRRDFTFEDFDTSAVIARPGYEADCRAFLVLRLRVAGGTSGSPR